MKDNVEIAKDYTDWHIKTGGYARDMTLRDHFAGLYMQGFLPDDSLFHEGIAKAAYQVADAMLKERSK
jgi:hypothetical protein